MASGNTSDLISPRYRVCSLSVSRKWLMIKIMKSSKLPISLFYPLYNLASFNSSLIFPRETLNISLNWLQSINERTSVHNLHDSHVSRITSNTGPKYGKDPRPLDIMISIINFLRWSMLYMRERNKSSKWKGYLINNFLIEWHINESHW